VPGKGSLTGTPAPKAETEASGKPKQDLLFEDHPAPAPKARQSSTAKSKSGPAPVDEPFGLMQQKCAHCGAALPPAAQICVECGTNQGTGTQIASIDLGEITAKKAQKKKVGVMVAAAVAAFLLVVGVTLFFLMHH
jgi:predicted nucleic acid-binding Zn ribbon protein